MAKEKQSKEEERRGGNGEEAVEGDFGPQATSLTSYRCQMLKSVKQIVDPLMADSISAPNWEFSRRVLHHSNFIWINKTNFGGL